MKIIKILNYTILNKKDNIDNNEDSNDLINHKFQRSAVLPVLTQFYGNTDL